MPFQNIIVEKNPPVAAVTINRPDKLNALNTATFLELEKAFEDIREDPAIRGVLVKGAGDKAFVAGADISEIRNLGLREGTEFSRLGQRVFHLIETLNKPVIALINGFALGGGCEFTMACHLRLATPQSKFGQPEVNLGLIPGYGGTQRLPRLVGRGRALELLLTGDMIDAQRAYEIGLLNRIVEAEQLEETGKKLLNKILAKGPLAVKNVLEVVHRGLNGTLEEGVALESDYFGMTCATDDMKEGTGAFLEKRKPEFKGK